jgi:hypothetical protein
VHRAWRNPECAISTLIELRALTEETLTSSTIDEMEVLSGELTIRIMDLHDSIPRPVEDEKIAYERYLALPLAGAHPCHPP